MDGQKLVACMGAVALATATSAVANETLQFDVNSLVCSVPTNSTFFPLPTGFVPNATPTGTITLSRDANAEVAGLIINGVPTPLAAGFSLVALAGTIDLVLGVPQSGSISFTVSNGVVFDSFACMIQPGIGITSFVPGATGGYTVQGLVFDGNLSGPTFGGINVANFFANQAGDQLFGNFINFAFRPNANGVDNDANLDLTVVIPLPTSVALGALGLTVIGARRRRS